MLTNVAQSYRIAKIITKILETGNQDKIMPSLNYFLQETRVGRAMRFISNYSGLTHVLQKFRILNDDGKKYPSGPLWAIGLYAATFGIASQIYENHLDRLENRASILISALLNKETGRLAAFQIDEIKEIEIPIEPKFGEPSTVFNSLIGSHKTHSSTIARLDEALALLNKDLSGKNLNGQNLRNANLQGTNLVEDDLRNADLRWANLQGAFLMRAHLEESLLLNTDLQGADLSNAFLLKADLRDANLVGAFLESADLREAFLAHANLQDAYLEGAKLQEAKLLSANLNGTFLSKANLQKANLLGANLKGAFLYNANLQGAILTKTNISLKQVQTARVFKSTILPDHIDKTKLTFEKE